MSITEETRRESYEKTDSTTISKRIVEVLEERGEALSAAEIARIMYAKHLIPYPVRQAVAPRLTELVDEGTVIVDGKAYDLETERNVAAYRLVRQ